MSNDNRFELVQVPLTVASHKLNVAALRREHGALAPIIFLHGFGSTKEDYADIIYHREFDAHPFIAYDAPGAGETQCEALRAVSIPFLVETAEQLLAHFEVERFHLVGHSMGGLTALILAHRHPDRVLSFTDIEGNVSPEDCFFSRQIHTYARSDDELFFRDFIERARQTPAYATRLYAAALRQKVRPQAVRGIFSSMVELSDHGDLLTKFVSLPFPRMFMYGQQNASLSYLDQLRRCGVALAEIPQCGHFPMYSNPVEMWAHIYEFIKESEACSRHHPG